MSVIHSLFFLLLLSFLSLLVKHGRIAKTTHFRNSKVLLTEAFDENMPKNICSIYTVKSTQYFSHAYNKFIGTFAEETVQLNFCRLITH